MRKKRNFKRISLNLSNDVINKLNKIKNDKGIFIGELIELLVNTTNWSNFNIHINQFNKDKRNNNSKVFFRQEARKIMEIILGKKLLSGEVVHHIDADFMNNSMKNLKLFKSQKEHMLEGHNMIYKK